MVVFSCLVCLFLFAFRFHFLYLASSHLSAHVDASSDSAVTVDAFENHLRLNGHIHSDQGDEYEAKVRLVKYVMIERINSSIMMTKIPSTAKYMIIVL
jgi:hypothetical protein